MFKSQWGEEFRDFKRCGCQKLVMVRVLRGQGAISHRDSLLVTIVVPRSCRSRRSTELRREWRALYDDLNPYAEAPMISQPPQTRDLTMTARTKPTASLGRQRKIRMWVPITPSRPKVAPYQIQKARLMEDQSDVVVRLGVEVGDEARSRRKSSKLDSS